MYGKGLIRIYVPTLYSVLQYDAKFSWKHILQPLANRFLALSNVSKVSTKYPSAQDISHCRRTHEDQTPKIQRGNFKGAKYDPKLRTPNRKSIDLRFQSLNKL